MSDESRNWRDLAIAYIQSGEVGFESMVGQFGYELTVELFRAAGIDVPNSEDQFASIRGDEDSSMDTNRFEAALTATAIYMNSKVRRLYKPESREQYLFAVEQYMERLKQRMIDDVNFTCDANDELSDLTG
jgi:hypothetical protein